MSKKHKIHSDKFSCLLCGEPEFKIIHHPVRGDNSKALQVVSCQKCNHKQLYPYKYEIQHYIEDRQVQSSIKDHGTPFENFIKNSWIQAERRASRIKSDKISIKKDKTYKIADIGSGYGFFTEILKRDNPELNVFSIEPSEARVETGKNLIKERFGSISKVETNITTLDDSLANLHQQEFDLVTLWHVIEHLTNPEEAIKNAWQMLKPGGWLSIEVPNGNDDLLSASSGFANYAYMLEHIHHFSKETLDFLITKSIARSPDEIYGYQRYGIYNYIHWLEKNSPQGENPDFFPGKDRFWLEATWRTKREVDFTTDALVANIRKPELS